MFVRTLASLELFLVLTLSHLVCYNAEEIASLLEEILNSMARTGYEGQGYDVYRDPYIDQQPLVAMTGMDPYGKSGYAQPISYAPSYKPTQSYAPIPQYAPPPVYAPMYYPPPTYYPEQSYGYGGYGAPSGYDTASMYEHMSYGYRPKPVKIKKVYIPVAVKRKKKKMKIISVQKGFFIPGGTQLFGKYKTLKACEKACAATPNCFAGDYNPWFKKCYIHSNYTACGTLNAHKKLIHFKKVPCAFPEAPEGRVMLGVQIFKGIEQKGIKSLSDCLKKCAAAGMGIPAQVVDISKQICFGIDYDFGTHKCYFHVNNNYPPAHFCPVNGDPPLVPRDTVPNPSVISIIMCPGK